MSPNDFARERALFEAREWGAEDAGRYALVIAERLQVFDDGPAALREGLRLLGPGVPFFCRRIKTPAPKIIIPCVLGLPASQRAALEASGVVAPADVETRALVDTGSARTSIQAELIKEVGLTQVDNAAVRTGQGSVRWPVYWGALGVDEARYEGLFYATPTRLSAPIILGMDILTRGDILAAFSQGRVELRFGPAGGFVP